MQKREKQREEAVETLERIAEELARLLVHHIDEIKSLKNNNYESKIKK